MNDYRPVWFLVILVIIISFILAIAEVNYKKADKTPVEEREIEQLEDKHNKLEIEIDSLEHEKKITIDSIKLYDDSSTLDLWYKLLKS